MPTNPIIRQRPFQRYWIGVTTSGLATWGLNFVLGLGVTQGALTSALLGAALAARGVGFLVGVLFGGSLSDRHDARKVIFWSSLLAAAASVMTAGALATNLAPLLLLAAGLSGAGQGASRPAYQAMMLQVVPEEHRQQANAAASLSVNLSLLLGPTAATALALLAGLSTALIVIALFWLFSAFCPSWPPQTERIAEQKSLWQDYLDGFYEARRLRWFFPTLAALSIVIAVGYSATNVLLPIVAKTFGAGLMVKCLTAYTLGGIAAAYFVGKGRDLPFVFALLGLGAYGLAPLGLMIPQFQAVPIVLYAAAGAGIQIFNILWFTRLQKEAAPDKLARVSSIDFVCSFGIAPLGLAAISPVATYLGLQPTLAIAGAFCFGAAVLAWAIVKKGRAL